MARRQEEFRLAGSFTDMRAVCHQAFAAMGWSVTAETATSVSGKEPFKLLSFHWPATVRVEVAALPDGSIGVRLEGSVFGFGPIQNNHLQRQLTTVRDLIARIAAQPPR
jgi:hypothetical protein